MRVLSRQLLTAVGIWLMLTGVVRADVIRLSTGGEIRGELRAGAPEDETLSIETQSGTLITVPRDQIDFVEERDPLIEEYITRSRTIVQTVDEKWKLAEWCRINHLSDQRREQLEQILDLDPDHQDVRRILGYVKHLGRWMTHEDKMAEMGYIRYQGKWVTRQELELKQANARHRDEELAWIPKVRARMVWLTGNDRQRAATGLAELQSIRDPHAVAALTKLMAQHQAEDIRLLFCSILGNIEGPVPVIPLVDRILRDGSFFVRREALKALTPARYPIALPHLIQALSSKSNEVICNAAEALGEIGDERAVPALIDALVTSHPVQVQVPAGQAISFSSSPPGIGPFSGALPPGVEIAARTGQLPYGVSVVQESVPRQMKTITVTQQFKNLPVLNSLEKLTGNNLGFNERDWHFWWAVQRG